jgi:hypothetical protein
MPRSTTPGASVDHRAGPEDHGDLNGKTLLEATASHPVAGSAASRQAPESSRSTRFILDPSP